MSRLEELIAELCPDRAGVYSLEQIAHYAKKRIDASQVDETSYVGVENLLQNKQGKTVASSVPANGAVIAFEKYFGLVSPTVPISESKVVDYSYTADQTSLGMVAESPIPYGEEIIKQLS